MNLFKDLRKNYGQKAVQDLRALENVERKISRFRCHRVFTLRAKDSGLIPPSLRLKCPINTKSAKSIVEKAEKALLRERIRVVSNKIRSLEVQKTNIISDLNSCGFSEDEQQQISRHVENSRES